MRKRDAFRRTEYCLYHYRKNLVTLDMLRSEIAELLSTGDVHAQDYTGRMNTDAGNADPVSSYVCKVLTLEHRISVLEKYTAPITQLLDDLQHSTDNMSRHYLQILKLFYFGGLTVSRILEKTHWNRNTFYSRRHSLVSLAVGYIFREKD